MTMMLMTATLVSIKIPPEIKKLYPERYSFTKTYDKTPADSRRFLCYATESFAAMRNFGVRSIMVTLYQNDWGCQERISAYYTKIGGLTAKTDDSYGASQDRMKIKAPEIQKTSAGITGECATYAAAEDQTGTHGNGVIFDASGAVLIAINSLQIALFS